MTGKLKFLFIAAFCIMVNIQFTFCQKTSRTRQINTINYSEKTKKMLPAKYGNFFIEIRRFPKNFLEKYKNDPLFNYNRNHKEPIDWISKIKNWINQQIAALQSSKVFSKILDYFYYALAFLAILLIVRGLIKGDRRGLFFGRISNNQINTVEYEEDLSQMNFDELIMSSIAEKNYKLATRYLFLKSLVLLSNKKFIQLKNNKTNNQYLSEIEDNKIQKAFRNVTYSFEWIWYGDFPVDEITMGKSREEFNNLFELMSI